MSTLDELDPFSPEYEAELERLQNEEDAANGNVERGARPAQSETSADPDDDSGSREGEANEQTNADAGAKPADGAPVADDTKTEAGAQAQEAPTADGKVAGVASKDGTKVLPYGALKGAREAAKAERQARERAEAEAERLRAENEALKQGKPLPAAKADAEGDELSADDLEDLKNLSPEMAAKVERLQSRAKQAPAEQAAEDPAAAKERERDAVQEDIDSVPALVEWQTSDPEKWSRAVAIDDVLKTSRKWADKPRAERFAEVARQVADEYDIQIDSPTSGSNTASNRATTAAPQIARTPPSTLSDFKGGKPPATDSAADLSPAALHRKFAGMSDEEIDAYLSRLG